MTPAYDRELVARMLESVAIGTVYGRDAVSEQIRLLREADNAEAESVGTVNSRSRLRRIAAEKGEPAPRFDASEDGLQTIIADIRHSAKVDDYEPQQIAFLESIADRLAASWQGVKWHHPDCAGECLSCLIERKVLQEFGTQGRDWLAQRVAASGQRVEGMALVPKHYAENVGYAAAMLEQSESVIDRHNAPPLRALASLLAAAPAAPVVDDAMVERLAQQAYEVHSTTPVGQFPNDDHWPKWRAVVRMVAAALAGKAQEDPDG